MKSFLSTMIFHTLILGADHGGFDLKEGLKAWARHMGFTVEDMGTDSAESVDYPPIAKKVSEKVLATPGAMGLLICGSGLGMSMAANRFLGIRAALCHTPELALLARQHNDANVLVLGGRFLNMNEAVPILKVFLKEPFEGGRHERRVRQIDAQAKPPEETSNPENETS